jgi:hypothetical protein
VATTFVSADLDELDRAIAQRVLSVSFSDGRSVTFSTFDELVKRRNYISKVLGNSAGRQRLKAEFTKGTTT